VRAADGADDDVAEAELLAELRRAEQKHCYETILLRGAPGQDIWGELETRSKAFLAVGCEGDLRAMSELPAKHWERARATGSSAADGRGDFDDEGLIVRDAGDKQGRWLPRSQLANYMKALHVDDPAGRLQLTQALDEAIPATSPTKPALDAQFPGLAEHDAAVASRRAERARSVQDSVDSPPATPAPAPHIWPGRAP
jgi:hypothetical protein